MIVEDENTTGMKITSTVLCFSISTVLLYVIFDLYKKRRLLSFSKDLQIFRFYPIVGNSFNLIGDNFLLQLLRWSKKYSLPFTVWIGHECHYLTADVEEIKVILNHPKAFEKSQSYTSFHLMFRNSIILEKYEEWKIDRKVIQKSFNQQVMKGFVDTFYEKSCNLVEAISGHPSKDKTELFLMYSLDSFCANNTGWTKNIDLNINNIINRSMGILGKRIVSAHLFPEFIWKYSQEGRTFFKDADTVRLFTNTIFRNKKQQLLVNKEMKKDFNNLRLMDLMLDNEYKVYNEEDTCDQLVAVMLAATDTTGLTLAYTFTLLGMNPKAQEKVYEEVIDTIGPQKPICHSDLLNLKYTERALFETLRLLPTIPLIEKFAAEDIDLGTRIVPAGANLCISIINVHRSETYWKDPLVYDPDRFLPEEIAKRCPYTFLPFSAGPRNCVGMKYAIMAAKIAIANVIRKYEVFSNYKSVEDLKMESALSMRPTHDLDCEFIPRKY